MGLSTVLKAKPRTSGTSNAARRLRAEGFLPAVFYGPSLPAAQTLTLDYKEFKNAFTASEGNRSLYTLEVEGQAPTPVLLKDYQVNPLSRKLVHADFYKVDPNQPLNVKVPLVLTGKPIGVEKGGQLQQGEREVIISALPSKVPAELEVDVTALALGQSLHFDNVKTPEGVKLAYNVNLAVASVVLPKGVKAEAEAESAAPVAAPVAPEKAAPAKKK